MPPPPPLPPTHAHRQQDDFGFSKQEILAYYASFMEVRLLDTHLGCGGYLWNWLERELCMLARGMT